jgi:hypothetical protein
MGTYDPGNGFGNPQPSQCGTNRQHTRKHNGGADVSCDEPLGAILKIGGKSQPTYRLTDSFARTHKEMSAITRHRQDRGCVAEDHLLSAQGAPE